MSLYILIGFFLLLGSVFGWISFFKIQKLSQQLETLQKQLLTLISDQPSAEKGGLLSKSNVNEGQSPSIPESPWLGLGKAEEQPSNKFIKSSPETVSQKKYPKIKINKTDWFSAIKNNWMIWLGGTCVALSGIFLVKYSVDQGLLGPGARIAAGIIMGLMLHAGAEWLRRNNTSHPAFAALAAGGSITLFAALLSALHLYQMVNPTMVFLLLACVAMITMALAILHGPVLAGIGILGAYLVPLMVGDGPGGAASVLLYTLIISASALVLIRYIYKDWLWLGVLAGGLAWWLLTLNSIEINNWRGIYLTAFAYLLTAVPTRDWFLQQTVKNVELSINLKQPIKLVLKQFFVIDEPIPKMLSFSFLLIIVAQFISIIDQGFEPSALFNWSPLVILVLIVGGNRQYLNFHPWVLIFFQLFAWIISQGKYGNLVSIETVKLPAFFWYCLLSTFLYSALSFINYRRNESKLIWISLTILAPLLFLALSYMLSANLEASIQWGLIAAVLGGVYLLLAMTILQNKIGTQTENMVPAWLFIGSHLAYSLAVAMFLREASMTLALAVQIISLSWVIKRFELQSLGWLLKIVVAIVILRLSLNPWLERYPIDIHWSLWTYGGATLCCFIGGLQLRKWPELQKWAYGATLHLLALTLWSETRYWLYEGNVYAQEYDLIEAALNLSIFGSLGLVYYLKENLSKHLSKLYRIYSQALIIFALVNYTLILLSTLASTTWISMSISQTKIFNIMLLAYGMPIILGYLYYRYYLPQFARLATIITAGAGFIFVSLQIRHLWHGEVVLSNSPLDGELYTYSAVWLIMAVAAILSGTWRFGEDCYRAGMILLVIVIAKLFLIDMSDLEGLLRVASFMGMGFGLLGIAFLHQRLNNQQTSE